jgi:hypothetical protein
MFSIFRCLFWLGLVFSHIAALEGTNAAALARQAAQAASVQAATSLTGLGQGAIDAASRQCADHAGKCLAIAAQAARLTQDAAPSHDSLNAGDRTPAFRMSAGKASTSAEPSR